MVKGSDILSYLYESTVVPGFEKMKKSVENLPSSEKEVSLIRTEAVSFKKILDDYSSSLEQWLDSLRCSCRELKERIACEEKRMLSLQAGLETVESVMKEVESNISSLERKGYPSEGQGGGRKLFLKKFSLGNKVGSKNSSDRTYGGISEKEKMKKAEHYKMRLRNMKYERESFSHRILDLGREIQAANEKCTLYDALVSANDLVMQRLDKQCDFLKRLDDLMGNGSHDLPEERIDFLRKQWSDMPLSVKPCIHMEGMADE